jgi:hypothetical protein
MSKKIIVSDVAFERMHDPNTPKLKIWESDDKRIRVSGTTTMPFKLTIDGIDYGPRFADFKLAMRPGVNHITGRYDT